MVLIISENLDPTTSDVISWLNYFKLGWYRINENDVLTVDEICFEKNEVTKFRLLVNNIDVIEINEIKAFWYRRGIISLNKYLHERISFSDSFFDSKIFFYLKDELDAIIHLISSYLLSKTIFISNFFKKKNSKLSYLYYASQCGLNIPDTFILTDIEQLKKINNPSDSFITKDINEGFVARYENEEYFNPVTLINDNDLSIDSSTFFPTLFQKNISKFIELRIFVINNECYTMAIFSQNNEKTKQDFRNYDDENPNRCIPYSLPQEIELKINDFMKTVDLNCGSIDMILTHEGQYVFLEINPVGQFAMVSEPCNYYLEMKISEILGNLYYDKNKS